MKRRMVPSLQMSQQRLVRPPEVGVTICGRPVCTENLGPEVVVMKSAQNGT
jgi:hypothetical protein